MSDIFISYARDDKEKAKSLAGVLAKQGWSVWWDPKIPPGKSWPEVIEEALLATKCVVALWSKASRESKWVKKEARNADQRSILIPVLIEDVKVPFEFDHLQAAQLLDWKGEISHPEAQRLIDAVEKILGIPRKVKSETKRVDAKKIEDEISKQENIENRAVEEKAGLQSHPVEKVELKPIITEKTEPETPKQVRQVHRPEEADKKQPPKKKEVKKPGIPEKKNRLVWLLPSILVPFIAGMAVLGIYLSKPQEPVPSPDIIKPESNKTVKEPVVPKAETTEQPIITKPRFRSTPIENLSEASVKAMLKDKGFYENRLNDSASGFSNDYELQNDGKVVFDRASGIMWQQSGSDEDMTFKAANAYIIKLNRDQFAGYNDWRLPTLEEAMSLMEPSMKKGDMSSIDPVFDKNQKWILTSDLYSALSAWVVVFYEGTCEYGSDEIFVRAVRSSGRSVTEGKQLVDKPVKTKPTEIKEGEISQLKQDITLPKRVSLIKLLSAISKLTTEQGEFESPGLGRINYDKVALDDKGYFGKDSHHWRSEIITTKTVNEDIDIYYHLKFKAEIDHTTNTTEIYKFLMLADYLGALGKHSDLLYDEYFLNSFGKSDRSIDIYFTSLAIRRLVRASVEELEIAHANAYRDMDQPPKGGNGWEQYAAPWLNRKNSDYDAVMEILKTGKVGISEFYFDETSTVEIYSDLTGGRSLHSDRVAYLTSSSFVELIHRITITGPDGPKIIPILREIEVLFGHDLSRLVATIASIVGPDAILVNNVSIKDITNNREFIIVREGEILDIDDMISDMLNNTR